MKKVLSIFLAVTMLFSMSITAFATDNENAARQNIVKSKFVCKMPSGTFFDMRRHSRLGYQKAQWDGSVKVAVGEA